MVGCRWYNAKSVKPLFPFGFGLSYTSFGYSNLHMNVFPGNPNVIAEVLVSITNTGKREGSEIVQLYVAYPSAAGEPPKQLRNFGKVDLKPNTTKDVRLSLTKRDISIWNADSHAWQVVEGSYQIMVGSSSESIHLYTVFQWSN
jgi:beta-glucosidase